LEVAAVTRSAEQHKQDPDSRFKVRLTISNDPDQNSQNPNYVVNMSTGGMFIETSRMLPVDTLLRIELVLPGKETPITCKARVAWTNDPHSLKKQSLPHGMGLQFLTPLSR
jgi:uncharacterized protein (TIGR02266 family)